MCLKELGQLAARELLDAIDGRPSHGLRRLPCRLVIRESTGQSAAPGRGRLTAVFPFNCPGGACPLARPGGEHHLVAGIH